MSAPTRVLVIAHGHPDLSAGGGEVAAWNQHRALAASEDFSSVFLARHDDPSRRHGGTPFSGTNRPDEILFHATMPDWFRFSQPDGALVWRDFRDALDTVRPDIVHFHHYVHLGLELLREVKNRCPDTPILMTLHEYFAICHNHGQMMKRHDDVPCERATATDCARCFPERTRQDFALREGFIKSHLDLVDRFIAPSRFLARRYVEWGIDAARIEVIENLLAPSPPATGDRPASSQARLRDGEPMRFAFFGQVNHFKGVELLLDAAALLPEALRRRCRFDVHGSGLERQPRALRERIGARVDALGAQARLHGAYRPAAINAMMHEADWMIVPSRWWENSPVVILEARRAGLPVICADIGGMAEKIDAEVTGLHFRANQASSLAARLRKAIIGGEPMRRAFAERMAASGDPAGDLERHLAVHRERLRNGAIDGEMGEAIAGPTSQRQAA